MTIFQTNAFSWLAIAVWGLILIFRCSWYVILLVCMLYTQESIHCTLYTPPEGWLQKGFICIYVPATKWHDILDIAFPGSPWCLCAFCLCCVDSINPESGVTWGLVALSNKRRKNIEWKLGRELKNNEKKNESQNVHLWKCWHHFVLLVCELPAGSPVTCRLSVTLTTVQLLQEWKREEERLRRKVQTLRNRFKRNTPPCIYVCLGVCWSVCLSHHDRCPAGSLLHSTPYWSITCLSCRHTHQEYSVKTQ